MTMWTKQMRLDEVTEEQFTALEKPWSSNVRRDRKSKTLARFCNPVIGESYEDLIHKFVEHPYAHRINVRAGNEWHRVYHDKINQKVISDIARLASNDILQVNHFEMKFRIPGEYADHREKLADLEFVKRGNLIMGYKAQFHCRNIGLFNSSQVNNTLPYISAIWDPNWNPYLK